MIKFFRHIRKQLLGEGKTGKYFKYAIGEILLVMIGILLALQVNNWNENKKSLERETIYLQGLKEDFIISQKALDRVIKKSDRVEETIAYLIDIIKQNPSKVKAENMDSLLLSSSGYTIFMSSEGVINDIIGSGQLGLIKNVYIRKEIASWEANLKMIRARETLGKEWVENYKTQYYQYLDIANLEYEKKAFISNKTNEILDDVQLRNSLMDILDNSYVLNQLYLEKQKHIDTLIQVIDKELRVYD